MVRDRAISVKVRTKRDAPTATRAVRDAPTAIRVAARNALTAIRVAARDALIAIRVAARDAPIITKAARDAPIATKAARDAPIATKAARNALTATKAVRDAPTATKVVRDAPTATKAVARDVLIVIRIKETDLIEISPDPAVRREALGTIQIREAMTEMINSTWTLLLVKKSWWLRTRQERIEGASPIKTKRQRARIIKEEMSGTRTETTLYQGSLL